MNFYGTNNYPTLRNALFGAVKLTKNSDINKYKYSGYGIRFDGHEFYSHPGGGTGRNVIIFGVDMSSSTKIDNKGKDIHKFTPKDSKIVPDDLCLGNLSKDFLASNMKKTGFDGYIYEFSVNYNTIGVNDIKNIHKYLMKKNNIV